MIAKGEKAVSVQRKRERAWTLRLAGYSFPEIGQALEVSMPRAYTLWRERLDQLNEAAKDAIQHYRRVQTARLNVAVKAIWPSVLVGDLDAIKVLVTLMRREAALLGLDAPAKVDITARIREVAVAEGLDPDEAVREAERVVKNMAL